MTTIDPAAMMQQLRERDAAAMAADPVAVCRQMLAAYAFPRTDAAALAAVLDEVGRLRAAERQQLAMIGRLADRVDIMRELLSRAAERRERREPIVTLWGVV